MPSVLGSVAPLSLSACLSLSLSLSLALSLAVSYSFAYTHTYSRSYFLSLSTSLTNNKYSFREPLRQNSALVNFLNSCLKSTVVLEKFFLIVSSFVRNEKNVSFKVIGYKAWSFFMKLKSRAYVVASLRMLNTVDMCGTKLSITGIIKRDALLSRDCRLILCWFESKNKLLDSSYTCPTFFSHISNLPDDGP